MIRSEVIAALVNIDGVEIGEANAMAATATGLTGVWVANHRHTVTIQWHANHRRFYVNRTTGKNGLW